MSKDKAYETLLKYRQDEIGESGIITFDEALEELINSHRYLTDQMNMVAEYQDYLDEEDEQELDYTDEGYPIYDVKFLFLAHDISMSVRNVMFEVLEKHKLVKEFETLLRHYQEEAEPEKTPGVLMA
jgi:hypothetical protein